MEYICTQRGCVFQSDEHPKICPVCNNPFNITENLEQPEQLDENLAQPEQLNN